MKKRIIFGILAVWMAVCLSGCCMSHEWQEATCTEPQTCAKCGKTKGKELGHEWAEGDCTQGEAAGHKWQSATCTEPQICSVCGETVGRPAGHKWLAATCTAPKTCSACGSTEGTLAEHKWKGATCTEPQICSVCGATEGEALGHSWEEADCLKAKTCSRCRTVEGEALGHELNDFHACIRCKTYFGSGTYYNFADVKVGDTLYFGKSGRYSTDLRSYSIGNPIEWVVLDSQDGRLLLLSKYFLDYDFYEERKEEEGNSYSKAHLPIEKVNWENSSIRTLLNNAFLYTSFSIAERKAILDTEIDDPDCGNPTADKIFLLSLDEFRTYYINNASVAQVCGQAHTTGEWWLRTKAEEENTILGGTFKNQHLWTSRYSKYKQEDLISFGTSGSAYIRPAMWIPEEMELFEEKPKDELRIPQVDLTALKYGDKFVFGAFEMDGDYRNGSEPLEWYVMETSEDYVSAISVCAFNTEGKDRLTQNLDTASKAYNAVYGGQTLTGRDSWLERFYQEGFSDAEKEMLYTDNNKRVWLFNGRKFNNIFNDKKIPVNAATWDGTVVSWAMDGYGFVDQNGRIFNDGKTVWKYVRPCIRIMKTKNGQQETNASQVKVGDLIKVGSYEQDNDLTNGKEPISWRVLKVQGDEALVVSDKALDHQPYDTAEEDKKYFWSKCSLRDWLNKEFYEEAFTEEERALIVSTETSGILIRPGSGLAQEETYDYIFCLYKDEILGSMYAVTEPTPYAESRGVVRANEDNCGYWLRGSGESNAPVMQPGGEKASTATADNMFAGVRPAMWIKLQ